MLCSERSTNIGQERNISSWGLQARVFVGSISIQNKETSFEAKICSFRRTRVDKNIERWV